MNTPVLVVARITHSGARGSTVRDQAARRVIRKKMTGKWYAQGRTVLLN